METDTYFLLLCDHIENAASSLSTNKQPIASRGRRCMGVLCGVYYTSLVPACNQIEHKTLSETIYIIM